MHRFASLLLLLSLGTIGSAHSAESPGAVSLDRLKTGNARFVSTPDDVLWLAADQRAALAKGQTPFATILSCADSRVPPEIVFRANPGDLFVVRAAGHVPDRSVLASVEYATEHLHVPLVVVMGHEFCGAVKAASDTPATTSLGPNLDFLLKAIRPSVDLARRQPEAERLHAAILENVEETLNDMVRDSAIMSTAGAEGHVTFVGAYYELTTGKVQFSEPLDLTAAPSVRAHTPSHPAAKGDGR